VSKRTNSKPETNGKGPDEPLNVTARSWIWAADRLWDPKKPYTAHEKAVVFAIVKMMFPNENTGEWAVTKSYGEIAKSAGCSVWTVRRQLAEHLRRMPLIKVERREVVRRVRDGSQRKTHRYPCGKMRFVLLVGVEQKHTPPLSKNTQGVCGFARGVEHSAPPIDRSLSRTSSRGNGAAAPPPRNYSKVTLANIEDSQRVIARISGKAMP
jgi:hypothetical protein